MKDRDAGSNPVLGTKPRLTSGLFFATKMIVRRGGSDCSVRPNEGSGCWFESSPGHPEKVKPPINVRAFLLRQNLLVRHGGSRGSVNPNEGSGCWFQSSPGHQAPINVGGFFLRRNLLVRHGGSRGSVNPNEGSGCHAKKQAN